MSHTPDQARELWCPMVRIARQEVIEHRDEVTLVAGCNTDALGGLRVPKSCRCIADQCAMWRWNTQLPHRRHQACSPENRTASVDPSADRVQHFIPQSWTFVPYNKSNGHPAHWEEGADEAFERRSGFCGLAPIHHTT